MKDWVCLWTLPSAMPCSIWSLLANSVTLTPGTITAEVNIPELLVLALDEDSANDLVSKRLEEKISWVFEKKGPK